VRGLTLFGRADKLFDKRYATAGTLAGRSPRHSHAIEAGLDERRHAQFMVPGAPRAEWVDVRYRRDAL